MAMFRATYRLFCSFAYTLLCYLALLAAKAVGLFARHTGQQLEDRVYRCWGLGLCWLLGARLSISGAPPPSPCLLVSNHLSYIDILILSGLTGCVFVAKAEIDRWPVMGLLSRSVGTLFIDRTNRRDTLRVGELIKSRLAEGRSVAVFAEGTTTCGETVIPFKASLLAPATQLSMPVHCATLTYRTPPGAEPARDSICWWGNATLAGHMPKLFRLPGFCATVTFAEEPIQDSNRKLLAQRLREAILKRFTPVTGSEDGCNPKKF